MPRAYSRPTDPDDEPALPSRTQLKKEMLALQELGEAVSELPASRLAALPIEDRLRDAIAELHRTRSHGGRRRQVQYIGKLMRLQDVEPLREAVASFRLGGAGDALALHQAETWRDQLIASDDALAPWLESHPGTDIQQLRNLVRSARKETLAEGGRHGRSYRELFQLVRRQLQAAADPALPEPDDDDTPTTVR